MSLPKRTAPCGRGRRCSLVRHMPTECVRFPHPPGGSRFPAMPGRNADRTRRHIRRPPLGLRDAPSHHRRDLPPYPRHDGRRAMPADIPPLSSSDAPGCSPAFTTSSPAKGEQSRVSPTDRAVSGFFLFRSFGARGLPTSWENRQGNAHRKSWNFLPFSWHEAPAYGFAGTEGGDGIFALPDAVGHRKGLALQRDPRFVCWQTIECRAVERGESFELVQCSLFFEDLGVDLEGAGCGEDAGAPTGAFLGCNGMRCAVGAEKKPALSR